MTIYTAKFGTALFGYSKFGVTDQNNAEAVTANNTLFTVHGETCTLTKPTITNDSMGLVTNKTTSDSSITAIFKNTGEEMRKVVGRGISVEGRLIMYTKISDSEVKANVGDKITRSNNKTYIIEELIGAKRFSQGVIHKSWLIRDDLA